IREVQERDPGTVFLSEAFTRPKVMKALAKLGFTQSYTYFTWRTTKAELSAYMHELTQYPMAEYFRPNFFVNTPDINPFHLESVAHDNAVAVAVAVTGHGPRQFWFHFGDLEIGPPNARRRVTSVENLVTGERHLLEWGGIRLRIDQAQDPALLFRCYA